jgi:hypothetical protein
VEILPDDATGDRVVLSGAFFFLTGPTGTYGEPRCGYMSFECPAGQEAMCRMQWQDLRKAIGSNFCEGFGTWGMVSNATLHTDPKALVKPDAWDLGMGISPGVFVDGKCGPALKLNCAAAPPADAGAPDTASPTPDSAPPAPDAAEPGRPGPADAAADAPVPPAGGSADAALAPQPAKSSGCAVGGTGGLLPLVVAFLALARRARR